MKIAIYGSRRQEQFATPIGQLLRCLALSGAELYMDRKLYSHLTVDLGMSLPGVAEAPADFARIAPVDIVLSIGGDGTFLRTAVWVGDTETPILGINTGHLGYLAPLAVEDAPKFVDNILEGNYRVERRALIEVVTPALSSRRYALNEVVMSKDDSASMVSATVWLDDEELTTYKADGVIVATPTGSTAYNLSVGGPIVQPTAPVWTLSPIAAHSLGMRPLVVCDDVCLTVNVTGRGHSFRLTVDGYANTLPMGTVVKLRRAPFGTRIVLPNDTSFPEVLHNKLMFN